MLVEYRLFLAIVNTELNPKTIQCVRISNIQIAVCVTYDTINMAFTVVMMHAQFELPVIILRSSFCPSLFVFIIIK